MLYEKFLLYLCALAILITFFLPLQALSEEITKGDYTINLTPEQKKRGKFFVLQITGNITGPACNLLKLDVNFTNEYANRAQKIFLIEGLQNNIPASFSDHDEIYPTKENSTWELNRVSVECRD